MPCGVKSEHVEKSSTTIGVLALALRKQAKTHRPTETLTCARAKPSFSVDTVCWIQLLDRVQKSFYTAIYQTKIINLNHQSPEGRVWVGMSERTFQLINCVEEEYSSVSRQHVGTHQILFLCQQMTVWLNDLIWQFKDKNNRPPFSVLLVSPSGDCFNCAESCCWSSWVAQTSCFDSVIYFSAMHI